MRLLTLSILSFIKHLNSKPPNFIVILVDDLGVNDVPWNNPQIKMSTLHKLADDGVILDNSYSLPVCTPSRTALMTGIYPFRLGLQRGFGRQAPEGVPLNTTMMPEYLKKHGYSTHGLGKWHLGFCSESYTPLHRGFDSYSGLYTGFEDDDYEELRLKETNNKQKSRKYKNKRKKRKKSSRRVPRSNKKPRKSTPSDKYSTKYYSGKAVDIINSAGHKKPFFLYMPLFTKSYPWLVDYKKKRKGKKHRQAMHRDHLKKINEVDLAVRDIVLALKHSGHYSNTVIIFLSDNGGKGRNDGSKKLNQNYPLRGSKGTMYEGGTKIPGFFHSPLIRSSVKRYPGILHMVDILPTMLHLISDNDDLDLDGVNHWPALLGQVSPPRHTMVYNIDNIMEPSVLFVKNSSPHFQIALRRDKFKLIWGDVRMLHRGYRHRFVDHKEVLELYNLEDDPEEKINLADKMPMKVKMLQKIGLEYYRSLTPPRFIGMQRVEDVFNYNNEFGGRSGWCQAVVSTHCTSSSKSRIRTERFLERNRNSTIQVFYGQILDAQGRKQVERKICATDFE